MAKNPAHPALSVVPPNAIGGPPPRDLGPHGRELWDAILKEYRITDRGGIELLAQACGALDLVETLGEAIARDGAVVYGRAGPRSPRGQGSDHRPRVPGARAGAARRHHREHQDPWPAAGEPRLDGRERGVMSGCPCRKLDPHVLLMQSTQDWAADYATNGLDGARDRRILVQ